MTRIENKIRIYMHISFPRNSPARLKEVQIFCALYGWLGSLNVVRKYVLGYMYKLVI
jgi:hypothetical protein